MAEPSKSRRRTTIICEPDYRPGDARDECPNALHDHPLPDGYLAASDVAAARLRRGWANPRCPDCGLYGWRRGRPLGEPYEPPRRARCAVMATSSDEQRVTDEQLTEWDELASLATPSPWHGEHGEYGCVRIGDFGWVCSGPNVPEYDVDSDQGKADAEFIAHAREAVPALIAELRASRAREAELAAEVETWQGRCSADQDNMTRFRRRAVAAEAERDVLQQCIDKALAITYASDDGTKYAHTHRRGEGEPECPACWAHDVRTALTGAETASSDSGVPGHRPNRSRSATGRITVRRA